MALGQTFQNFLELQTTTTPSQNPLANTLDLYFKSDNSLYSLTSGGVETKIGTGGTVTSVALAAPALFTVTGSPVTTSGTLTLSYSGSALPIANGGTNQTTTQSARGPSGLNIDERTTVNATNYSAVSTDRYIAQIGSLSGGITITLPTAASVNPGQLLYIADESGTASTTNVITVSANGSDTIDGSASKTIRSAYGFIYLVSNGTNLWFAGVEAIGRGGTGLSTLPTSGQLLIGNSTTSNYSLSTLTAGSGISITNGAGSITIATGVLTVVTKAANYSILAADNNTIFDCDLSGGSSFTLTLPSPGTVGSGFRIWIKDSTGFMNTFPLTLARSASEKIEGLTASKIFSTAWGGWMVYTDGTNWFVI